MLHMTPSIPKTWRNIALSLILLFTVQFAKAQAWEYLTPIKTNSEVRGCSFLDEQRGIAVILASRSVFRTTDGGETWESMWTPAVNSNPTDVEWVTDNLLFIAAGNGDLFRSLDGGNTWANVNPPTAAWLYSVQFINETTGFVTGESGTVLKTTAEIKHGVGVLIPYGLRIPTHCRNKVDRLTLLSKLVTNSQDHLSL